MRIVVPILFWSSRLLTVLISSTGYLFFLLSTQSTPSYKPFISISLTLLIISGIIYIAYRNKNSTLVSLAPIGILAGFWIYFLFGGFVPSFGFISLLFSSLLMGILLALSVYSWTNNMSGGITYIALGVFYFLISYTRVPTQSLIVIAGIIVVTGILLAMSPSVTTEKLLSEEMSED